MQGLPGDIPRYWSSYANLSVRDILHECEVNRQLRDAVCRNKEFWQGLMRKRLTENENTIRPLNIRQMQGQLDIADELKQRIERIKTYSSTLTRAQRPDMDTTLNLLVAAAFRGYERLVREFLDMQPYEKYHDVLTSLASGAIQAHNDDLLEEILQEATDKDVLDRLNAFKLMGDAAGVGRPDLIARFREMVPNQDPFMLNVRIIDRGVEYLSKHPDDIPFRDHLIENIIGNAEDLSSEAFLVALMEDYPDFIERYRNVADPLWLIDVISSDIVEDAEPDKIALAHKVIDFLPVNDDLRQLFLQGIAANNVGILQHLLRHSQNDSTLLRQAIGITLREDFWNLETTRFLLPYMTEAQKRKLRAYIGDQQSYYTRTGTERKSCRDFLRDYEQILEVIDESLE